MVTCFPTRCHPPLTKPNETFQSFIVLSRDGFLFCCPVNKLLINNILIQLICHKEWQLQVLHVPDRPENDEDVITPRTDDPLSPSQILVAGWGFLDWSTILRKSTVIAISEGSGSVNESWGEKRWATSVLDSSTEKVVQDALGQASAAYLN
jgi:hypothetical protein